MAPEQPRLTFSQASPAERHGFLSEGPLGSVTVGKVLRLGTPFDQACDGGGGALALITPASLQNWVEAQPDGRVGVGCVPDKQP